jgi:chromosome partitioning protein
MTVFALYNIKGGVGKTATAVNLSWLSAAEGEKTLLWDLDSAGAASFYFNIKPRVKGGGRELISDKPRFSRAIKSTSYENLDLLPADISYRNLDLDLSSSKRPVKGLRRSLKPLRKSYDHIFLDCAPGISLVSENILAAVDVVLIPLIPTTLSVRALDQLLGFLATQKHKKVELLPFLTMVDHRRKLHGEVIELLQAAHPDMLQSQIPNSADVERMGAERSPLAGFAQSGKAMLGYRDLWHEIKLRLQPDEVRPAEA